MDVQQDNFMASGWGRAWGTPGPFSGRHVCLKKTQVNIKFPKKTKKKESEMAKADSVDLMAAFLPLVAFAACAAFF
jgi:hypothetical protein